MWPWLWPHTWPWPWIFMVKFWNCCLSEWEGWLTLHKGVSSRSLMTMTMTIWWPRSGVWIYQIVTGVTSVVGVPSTHLVGSDNGLSPGRRQAITRTNDGILLIGPLGTNFSEILSNIHTFSFKKMHLKTSSAKERPFCLGLNVLKLTPSCWWSISASVNWAIINGLSPVRWPDISWTNADWSNGPTGTKTQFEWNQDHFLSYIFENAICNMSTCDYAHLNTTHGMTRLATASVCWYSTKPLQTGGEFITLPEANSLKIIRSPSRFEQNTFGFIPIISPEIMHVLCLPCNVCNIVTITTSAVGWESNWNATVFEMCLKNRKWNGSLLWRTDQQTSRPWSCIE